MFILPELLILYQEYGVSIFSVRDFYSVCEFCGSKHNLSWYERRGYVCFEVKKANKKYFRLTFRSVGLCQKYIVKHSLDEVEV